MFFCRAKERKSVPASAFLSAQKEENTDKFSNNKRLKYNRVVKIIMDNKSILNVLFSILC